jgi:hypothetical protein
MSSAPRRGVHHRRRLPRWCGRLVLLMPALAVLLLLGPRPASAATLHVCPSGCPYTQLAPALAAAHSGDTITIGPGTYAGGVTIDVSVKLLGAGPGATIIHDGGPVLTIGVAGAASEPTVTIEGVTVTGGVTVGNLTPSMGRGGGIYIPRAAGPSTGATVTIRNSVIRGNSVAPSVATGDPPFADAGGGGISNDGTLTLDHTRVSDNRAGAASGVTSSAVGGGILNRTFGNLTLKTSVVTGNHSEATAPNGRDAEGGGIFMVAGTLTVDDSLISDNTVELSASFPSEVETFAAAGGIKVQGDAFATVRRTTITGNTVTGSNRLGDSIVACGGICTDGSLILRGSTVSDNHVSATTASSPAGNALADAGGLGTGCCQEVPATVVLSGTRFSGNSVRAAAPAGTALAHGGGIRVGNDKLVPVSDSVVSGNSVRATTTTGSVIAQGGGILNDGLLTVRNTTVSDNSGTGSGARGVVQGGGIWNGTGIFGPNLPVVQLTLADSLVTHNTLRSASPGITVQGGGLFTMFPVTLKNSVIAHNVPDQCYGC